MPVKSVAQLNFMRQAASDPDFAKKRGISQKTAQEFVDATKDADKLPERAGKARKAATAKRGRRIEWS